ncbi:hypothetical protein BDZ89DRAFT_468089 [Hymenopellis radicata]|nr:hypothetical protein BDZ89DRAFT_468089 [Hymenopellis radicata]
MSKKSAADGTCSYQSLQNFPKRSRIVNLATAVYVASTMTTCPHLGRRLCRSCKTLHDEKRVIPVHSEKKHNSVPQLCSSSQFCLLFLCNSVQHEANGERLFSTFNHHVTVFRTAACHGWIVLTMRTKLWIILISILRNDLSVALAPESFPDAPFVRLAV